MQYEENGTIITGLGGLYEILLDAGDTPLSGKRAAVRAKGNFRHEGQTPLVGDRVRVGYDEGAVAATDDSGGCAVIEEILPRRNALIRPPLANLDLLFLTVAAARPDPVTETADKLLSILEYNRIEPVVVVTKCDLAPDTAKTLCTVYERAGYPVFPLSVVRGEGVAALRAFLSERLPRKIAAFAGASGVGKSTLLNALFPTLSLETGAVSEKIARGRHTTRRVALYPVDGMENAYVADTPGFSMLDFFRFDFFKAEDLPLTMREFLPLLGSCRYTKCTHTKEEGCAVLDAVKDGRIAASRHASFLAMYEALKNKHEWSKK